MNASPAMFKSLSARFRPAVAGLCAAVMLVCAAPAWTGNVAAAQGRAVAVELSEPEQALVQQAEEYLNSITTLQSQFVQLAPNGGQTMGTIYMSRPGRMRLTYDPPVKDFIVADGRFLFYWDAEMRQSSSTPIGGTMAAFILRDNIRLSGDITVTSIYHAPGVVEIGLTESRDPGKGTIVLVFEDRPFQLKKWRIIDAQNLQTEVALLDPARGVSFPNDFFYFREPSSEGLSRGR